MKFEQMYFKGRKVFVAVDDAGEPVLEKGRAQMKYRLEDDRTYGPAPGNLSLSPGAAEEVSPTKPARRKTAKAQSKSPAPPAAPLPDDAIVAYTDGACSGNPGPAGLGYVISWPDGTREQKGEPLGQGTNNIAELTAIWRVLQKTEGETRPVVIHTDSAYSIGVLSRGWKAKANRELIESIRLTIRRVPGLELRKVKGHAGVPDNELVDDLARQAAETQSEV